MIFSDCWVGKMVLWFWMGRVGWLVIVMLILGDSGVFGLIYCCVGYDCGWLLGNWRFLSVVVKGVEVI